MSEFLGGMLLACALMGFAWSITAEKDLVVNCDNAPAQYKAAGAWIDSARHVRCSNTGEKGYIWYSDAIIK